MKKTCSVSGGKWKSRGSLGIFCEYVVGDSEIFINFVIETLKRIAYEKFYLFCGLLRFES